MKPANPKTHVSTRLRSILMICRKDASNLESANLKGCDSHGLSLAHACINNSCGISCQCDDASRSRADARVHNDSLRHSAECENHAIRVSLNCDLDACLYIAGRGGFFWSGLTSAACKSDCRSIHSSRRERLKRQRFPSLKAGTNPSEAYL